VFRVAPPAPPLSGRKKRSLKDKKNKDRKTKSRGSKNAPALHVYDESDEKEKRKESAGPDKPTDGENEAAPAAPISARQHYDNFVKRIQSTRTEKRKVQRRLEQKRKKAQRTATSSVISQIVRLANQAKENEN
jgi:hypothetical protein